MGSSRWVQRPVQALVCVTMLAWSLSPARADDTPADLIAQAEAQYAAGNVEQAMKLAGQAIEADPANARAWVLRGAMATELGKHEQAVADLNHALETLKHDDPRVYNLRGTAHFKLGHIAESIADFDRYLAAVPEAEPRHWQRGISYYYAKRFDEGRKQFEGYQTVDDNDVENVVWRYLCMAQDVGAEKAREAMLPVGHDRRVPMMVIYDLYRDKASVDDVLAAARAGEPGNEELHHRLFYAHLYVGLWHESMGQAEQSIEHMRTAVEKYPVKHYMGDAARVHLQLREAE